MTNAIQFIKENGVGKAREVDKLVYGHGINDASIDFKKSPDYKVVYATWIRMLERCFSDRRKNRGNAYKDVTCCKDWLSLSKFYEDILAVENFDKLFEGWHLDKDILIKRNKTYSRYAVSIIPKDINNLLVAKHYKNTGLPQGVAFKSKDNVFVAQITMFNRRKHLGRFKCPNAAFSAYKFAKEAHIKVVANLWKDRIAMSVYDSLINWEIEKETGGEHV